jgi:hypothetical protein
MLTIRPAIESDIAIVASRLRKADLNEIQAGSGLSPESAIREGFNHSEDSFTVEVDDEGPQAMFGFAPLLFGGASCWFLGSDLVFKKSPKTCHRLAMPVLAAAAKKYGHLYNTVWAGNTTHVRWLDRLGVKWGQTFKHPRSGKTFKEFTYV